VIATDPRVRLVTGLEEIRSLCPQMRLGQILAAIEMLGEDSTGKTLYDLEDDELASAAERFAGDLRRRLAEHIDPDVPDPGRSLRT
jgi:hypothetical protein